MLGRFLQAQMPVQTPLPPEGFGDLTLRGVGAPELPSLAALDTSYCRCCPRVPTIPRDASLPLSPGIQPPSRFTPCPHSGFFSAICSPHPLARPPFLPLCPIITTLCVSNCESVCVAVSAFPALLVGHCPGATGSLSQPSSRCVHLPLLSPRRFAQLL